MIIFITLHVSEVENIIGPNQDVSRCCNYYSCWAVIDRLHLSINVENALKTSTFLSNNWFNIIFMFLLSYKLGLLFKLLPNPIWLLGEGIQSGFLFVLWRGGRVVESFSYSAALIQHSLVDELQNDVVYLQILLLLEIIFCLFCGCLVKIRILCLLF